jgi:hypothetical protein
MRDGDPNEYRNRSIREVLNILASNIQLANTDFNNTLATETVYEHGFDPLDQAFKPNADPYQVFDQWIEVMPTEQIVAVEVSYDPKTDKQV